MHLSINPQSQTLITHTMQTLPTQPGVTRADFPKMMKKLSRGPSRSLIQGEGDTYSQGQIASLTFNPFNNRNDKNSVRMDTEKGFQEDNSMHLRDQDIAIDINGYDKQATEEQIYRETNAGANSLTGDKFSQASRPTVQFRDEENKGLEFHSSSRSNSIYSQDPNDAPL